MITYEKKPLALHICCAPDEAWVIHCLKDTYDLHCFFCNPNIAPEQEYNLRLSEARKVADLSGVHFDSDQYSPEQWESSIAGTEDTAEGGERCERCFLLRLRRTAEYTRSKGLSAFTTVMSVSPHKRIAMLNNAGAIAGAEYGLTYEPFDFKKNNGFLNSISLSKQLNLYRQDYCGCRLSKEERNSRSRKNLPVL